MSIKSVKVNFSLTISLRYICFPASPYLFYIVNTYCLHEPCMITLPVTATGKYYQPIITGSPLHIESLLFEITSPLGGGVTTEKIYLPDCLIFALKGG